MNKVQNAKRKGKTLDSLCVCLRPLLYLLATCKDGIYGQFSTTHIKMDSAMTAVRVEIV